MVDPAWLDAEAKAIIETYGGSGLDTFQKLLCQAYAEETAGDVYVFAPAAQDLTTASVKVTESVAWYGWEWPALTRNSKVDTIYRVDPTNTQNDREVLWTQGDAPSTQTPLGVRKAPVPLGMAA
jgi:hypothetical protein